MAIAASSSTVSPLKPAPASSLAFFGPATWLLAALAGLITVLAVMPDGSAEALQTAIGWLIIGLVAALGVMAIVKGVERLLDCETENS
ncbi:hypothetical protein [Polaromonas sp. A23]|uniref:hypothetical protein n=1 Tax=Polaromonas sp. A23 TaxID=1944133 RepID=UPI0009860AC7|nr:hypothetical protein [Polaromonas sp. A23]OOG39839.1 hypothetical protein B0B52_14550 [Polaromonas sp. A23]